jgi:hypothetical protein
MRAARADHDGGIVGPNVGPLLWQTRKLARVVIEVDAVLAPRLSTIDQTKRTPMQRMERMRDSEGLSWIARRRCNRLLRRTRTSSA